jgi:hypothetical protein
VNSVYTNFSKAFDQVRHQLDRVNSINVLGVIIDEKMNFSEHIDVILGKAFAILTEKKVH